MALALIVASLNRDAQAQERQNIYTQGLASMFANF
jgi:hypothetical protein